MAIVVSIVPYKFLPAKIGGQKFIALFNKYFSQHVQLVCLTVADNDNTQAENYEAISFFSNSLLRYGNLFYYFRARKIIKNKKASHILIEHPYMGWLGYMLKKTMGAKLIIHSHNIEGIRFKTIGKWWWKILWHYERWTHRQADYNFFIHDEDRRYAIDQFKLSPSKCMVVTYSIERNTIPSGQETQNAKKFIRESNSIKEEEKILFFNGSFNYKPNIDALEYIAATICPLLDQQSFSYKVIVCGPWLNDFKLHHPHLILKGYVDDIEPYFIGADLFINPVIEGGGIKTKLVEALGYNCNAVSTIKGSTGIPAEICNHKLYLVKDGDWNKFAEQIIIAANNKNDIGQEFYRHFFWANNTKKAAEFIESYA
jgi:glycosyltransferase involved in cell wall biosynthesis